MFSDHLIVKLATNAQAHEAAARNAAHWGARVGVAVDDYVKFTTEILPQQEFARDGRLQTWVLVPEDDPDTIDFYASCQTFTREVLALQPGQTTPTASFGHGISAVFVSPEHRGKGYAKQLMSLMHSVLAPHRYQDLLKAPATIDHPSTVSVLYSDLGDYYSRCAPTTGESGWTAPKSMFSTWPVSSTQVPLGQTNSLPVELLSESEATKILDSDDSHIAADLLELQKKDPSKTYFAFASTSRLNAFPILISKVTPGAPSNLTSWGAEIPGRKDFITWAFPCRNYQLAVTRLRATRDSFPVLLNAALQAARDVGCEFVEICNVPEDLQDMVEASGGETTERVYPLPAFKWYGQEPGSRTKNGDVVWALEERYCWC